MKIAILFSGRINRYQEHYENILTNIVQNNDADFFLSHSPECEEDIEKFCTIYRPKTVNNDPIHYGQWAEKPTTTNSSVSESALPIQGNECRKRTEPLCGSTRFTTEGDLRSPEKFDKGENATELLTSKGALHPEKLGDLSSYTCHPQSNSHNVMCMWVNRQRVFQDMRDYMIKNNVWYDLVVCTRLDTWCYEALNLSKYDNLSDTEIYVPNGCDWGGLNDQLAFGNYYAMEKYMMLYSNMRTILDILMTSIGYYGPEPILKVNIELNELTVHRFPLYYKLINGKMYHHP